MSVYISGHRANEISGAIWLIGLGILFVTGYWWPGILIVIGAGSIAQGLAEGRGWYGFQGGLWAIGLGIWFMFGARWEPCSSSWESARFWERSSARRSSARNR